MHDLHEEAVQSARELVEALANAREQIRKAEQTLRRRLKRVERGDHLATITLASDPAESRQAFDTAMSHMERCRHETRVRIFALVRTQGMSIGEVARTWGVSRQLASRYINEAKAMTPRTHPVGES